MDLSIIIVNWNSQAFLEKCLASVYENTQGLEFEVIVVDNASFDGCGEMIARQFPQVTFIQSPANLGFAGANNLGAAQSSGRVLLFLNPDTEVIADALRVMFKVTAHVEDSGVVGVKLLNTDGTVQTSCLQQFPTILNQALDADLLRNVLPKLSIWGIRPLLEKQAAPVAVDVISGACMMLKRNLFKQVGFFTTDYFMYSEDVDLCYKVHQAGNTNYYVDDAEVIHHGGASTSSSGNNHFSAIVMKDSRLKFFRLHRGRLYAMAYRTTMVLSSLFRCALLVIGMPLNLRQSKRLGTTLSRWIAVLRWGLGESAGNIPVTTASAPEAD